MLASDLGHRALWICTSTIVLIGCGAAGQAPSIATPAAAQNGATVRAKPARSGTLKGRYSGTYALTPCQGRGKPGKFLFSGSGKVLFLNRSLESGEASRPNSPTSGHGCETWSGSVLLASVEHPEDTLDVYLTNGSTERNPCKSGFEYIVAGGTGRFAGAIGEGNVACTTGPNGTYSDSWYGSLIF